MRILLRIVAGIVAVDAMVVAGLAITVARDVRRSRREIRDLERLWHLGEPRVDLLSRRTFARRLGAVAFATILAFSFAVVASPHARRVIASAVDPVVGSIRPQSSPAERASLGPSSAHDQALAGTPRATLQDRTPASARSSEPDARAEPPAPAGSDVQPRTNHTMQGPAVVAGVATATTAIEVTWSDVQGEVGFRIERSRNGLGKWTEITSTGPDVTAYDDKGLVPDTTYFYRVFASGEVGDSPPSDVVSATTGTVPATPLSVTAASGSPTEIDLAWADVTDETGYRVERSSDGMTEWVPIATTGLDVTAYADKGLSPKTTYFYRVVATGTFGDSSPSIVVSATTSPHPVGTIESTQPDPVTP